MEFTVRIFSQVSARTNERADGDVGQIDGR